MKHDAPQPGVLTAIGIRLRNKTIRRYSSRGAGRYEEHRHGARWVAEARAFEHFYKQVNPASVLDCPVGTGRWFETYRGNKAKVFGVDISKNMLAEAAEKAGTDGDVRLERADVLDPRASSLGEGYDLIVCSRFVYWLRPLELAIMLRKFHATKTPLLLAGAKVALEGTQQEERHGGGGFMRSLDRLRAQFYRAVVKRVYKESALQDIFEANGWTLADKRPIVTTRHVRYFYYLFARKPDDRGGNEAT